MLPSEHVFAMLWNRTCPLQREDYHFVDLSPAHSVPSATLWMDSDAAGTTFGGIWAGYSYG